MHSDPIADMLTRIRNASLAGLAETKMPYSKVKEKIAQVMMESKYVQSVSTTEEEKRKTLVIKLNPGKRITLKRISKPGQRIYKKAKEIYPLKHGYGLTIITTSQGIMTDKSAMEKKLGGEIICEIY
jgi:small subunit ribosomal protein S8